MAITRCSHKKAFGVYLWDTFDNETILLRDFNSRSAASRWARKSHPPQKNGADQIDIVNRRGDIIEKYEI